MGIKSVILVILVFILLSSSVYAVGFEWALGNSNTLDWLSQPYENVKNACFTWDDVVKIEQLGQPVLMLTESVDGHSCDNECQTGFRFHFFYKDREFLSRKYKVSESSWVEYHNQPVYSIVDKVTAGGSCDWKYKKCPGHTRCDFDGNAGIKWVDIDASGFESVFPRDGIKAIGPITDLIPSVLLPDNATIYVGAYTKLYGDILFWFGPAESEPTDPLKRDTNDYFDYINFCSDLNHDAVCDYIIAESCYDEGADWCGYPGWGKGVCCGADPEQITADTGLIAGNCTGRLYDGVAYCGVNLDGNYEWAPVNEVGAVHELLKCPGRSMVSEGAEFKDCEPGSADAKFFEIESVIGKHGYLCSNGELFECKGDGASYSWDQDFVAETGISTNDLVGSGGCPPKIIAYWPLDDGTAADSIGTYTGTIEGGGSTTGKINGGIHLEQGNKITLPADLPVKGNQFTVEAWVKPTETSGLRNIIEKDDSFRIAIDDELLVGAVHTGQPMNDFGSRRVVSNIWHHVALVYDGDKASLYLDGIAVTDAGVSGDIVWNDNPIIIGASFVGDIDDVAIYNKALRSSLIRRHAKMPSAYCQEADEGMSENYYCASDGAWTTDLDIKDESSCNKAGFVWTGNLCCSEDDDVNEYYNDHDTPPADLAKEADGGQTVVAHAGAQVSSTQIILTNKNQFATIKGPAKLVIETYSAESPIDIGACPPLGNPETIVIAPWEQKTIKILGLGEAGDPCRYRHKIITAEPFLAIGGCWDKDFVPIGHFAEPNIINYHGHFYSCGLPSSASELQIQDTQNEGDLIIPASLTCSDIKLNARGAGTHVVCNPGGKWQFTNNSVATTSSEIVWDITGTNASQYGCCGEAQCWTGFECVNIGDYYTDPVSGDSYFCEE